MIVKERANLLAGQLEALVQRTPIPLDNLPTTWSALLKAARLIRLDVPGLLRGTVIDVLRSLPAAIESDADRADRVAAWLVHVAAWITGQTDEPPADLTLG